jgi:quinolinate synthase
MMETATTRTRTGSGTRGKREPAGSDPLSTHTRDELRRESERLHGQLGNLGWAAEECALFAPLTLEIRKRAAATGATILAHSYQTPDILYGIADFRGDSLALSLEASQTPAEVIVFCGVRFMAETAKILSPGKTVLLPAADAGCSLDESITGADVRRLRQEHPGAAVVCYVNTKAEVKAESDVCCTSGNARRVVEAIPERRIVFVPDNLMGRNLQKETDKEIVPWHGTCIVHETFTPESLDAHRRHFPDADILVHTECNPDVIDGADLAGGTNDMIRHIRNSSARRFMLVTECGMADRMRVEFPDREFVGTCGLWPHMKRTELRKVLQVLTDPKPDQIIEVEEPIRVRAKRCLDRMFQITS